MSKFRGTLTLIFLAGLLVFLQYRLWFESGGMGDVLRYKKMLKRQTAENALLRKHNDELMAQVQQIQNSQDAAEARARSELGMVKQGETFYQVVKQNENTD